MKADRRAAAVGACRPCQNRSPRAPRRFSATASIPFFSVTYEGELLAREAKRLREEFTPEKRDELLHQIWDGAGNADTLRAQAEFSYYLTMLQVNSQERSSRGMNAATWVLAFATLGLVVATVALLFK